MVLLSDRGYAVAQIAHLHACGGKGGRTWLHRDQSKGLAGLEDEPRSGRPRKAPLAPQIVLTEALPVAPVFGTGLCRLDGRVAASVLDQAILGIVVPEPHPPLSESGRLSLAAAPFGPSL
ncbi:MAG: helix-turn-helix domain-containing protein [Armatimonadetes bacterium]|nr:helix-turn-helix domain-containing protein [Armatimonadota bacterium]